MYGRAPRGIQLGLERVRAACQRAQNPQRAFNVVHIAGTNGKGSVAAMTATALHRAGYHVGLFTSPHLCRFAERIQIDGQPVDDDTLTDVLLQAMGLGADLSFFETACLAALLAFRSAQVDVAVLEVGLGGRLDATNVVEAPLATAVTRIALDHVALLGDTLEAIAVEKAAIAKPRAPMVLGPLPAAIDAIARHHAHQAGASQVYAIGREVRTDRPKPGLVEVWVPELPRSVCLRPRLRGDHQLDNAAVAAAVCALASRTLTRLTPAAIEQGIAEATWPARLESLHDGDGEVLIDAAHNPDGIESLRRYLHERVPGAEHNPNTTALVFGAMADKGWRQMLQMLVPVASQRFYAEPAGRAPAPVGEMAKTFGGTVLPAAPGAVQQARQAVGPDGLVIVTGSIYLAGEVRACLTGADRDPPVAL